MIIKKGKVKLNILHNKTDRNELKKKLKGKKNLIDYKLSKKGFKFHNIYEYFFTIIFTFYCGCYYFIYIFCKGKSINVQFNIQLWYNIVFAIPIFILIFFMFREYYKNVEEKDKKKVIIYLSLIYFLCLFIFIFMCIKKIYFIV